MRVFNINNIELINPDLSKGYLKTDKIFVKHHNAIPAVNEQWHYEVVARYPNGGQDIQKVIDVPAAESQDAWDEYEEIYRYIEYTEEELTQIQQNNNRPSVEDRLKTIEAALQKLFNNN